MIMSCFNIGHPKVVLDVNFPVKIVVCNGIDPLFWGSIGLKISMAPQVWGSTVSPVVWQKCSGKDQLNVSLGWHNGRKGVSVKLIWLYHRRLKGSQRFSKPMEIWMSTKNWTVLNAICLRNISRYQYSARTPMNLSFASGLLRASRRHLQPRNSKGFQSTRAPGICTSAAAEVKRCLRCPKGKSLKPLPQRKWMRWYLGQREPALAHGHPEVDRTFNYIIISDILAKEKQ